MLRAGARAVLSVFVTMLVFMFVLRVEQILIDENMSPTRSLFKHIGYWTCEPIPSQSQTQSSIIQYNHTFEWDLCSDLCSDFFSDLCSDLCSDFFSPLLL